MVERNDLFYINAGSSERQYLEVMTEKYNFLKLYEQSNVNILIVVI